MTIVVEDGTGLANADSYVSVAEADLLMSATSYNADWAALTTGEKEDLLKAATRYLDASYRWYGKAKTNTQALGWPRTKNYNLQGQLIPAGTVPSDLKKATVLATGAVAMAGLDTVEAVGTAGPVKSWSGDGLSITYGGSSSSQGGKAAQDFLMGTRYPVIEMQLRAIGKIKDAEWLQGDLISEIR